MYALAATFAGLAILAAFRAPWKADQTLPNPPAQNFPAGGANYDSLVKLMQESAVAYDQLPNTATFEDPNGEPLSESDRNTILDAVLRNVLTDPSLEDVRGFYGTPGDSEFALVSNPERPGWPDSYVPAVDCYESQRIIEGAKVEPRSPPRLGIRLDKFNLREKSSVFVHPIEIVVFNAGGTGDDHSIINGGCGIHYDVARDGVSWTVTQAGCSDP